MSARLNMPPGFAARVYDVLIEECGCNASDKSAFVHEFEESTSQYGPTSQWRCQGVMGFGGKFHYPEYSVECYSEDRTEKVALAMTAARARLAKIRGEAEALEATQGS